MDSSGLNRKSRSQPVREESHPPNAKFLNNLGLQAAEAPKQVTIDVLLRLIKEKPDKMAAAARKWLRP